jgi:hypothetical protein
MHHITIRDGFINKHVGRYIGVDIKKGEQTHGGNTKSLGFLTKKEEEEMIVTREVETRSCMMVYDTPVVETLSVVPFFGARLGSLEVE